MFLISCAFIGMTLFLVGSSSNGLCILVFLREKFRHRIIAPYFIVLLCADSIYLLLRLTKLFYYSQTLFNLKAQPEGSCSDTLLARVYHHVTQTWPQTLVPLVNSETYMRFSLILMCIMTVQRTSVITRSFKRLARPVGVNDKQKHKWAFLFITLAFGIAYLFGFAGLTLFCSKANNREKSYEWFMHMGKYMENVTYLLTSAMTDQPAKLQCVNYVLTTIKEHNHSSTIAYDNRVCTEAQFMDIISYYFDQHQKSIVSLIQKIHFHQYGLRITRNEIRRKFHFHECLFPQEPSFFQRHYNFMYSRMVGVNRFTLLLVFGSVLPSLITIGSNIISVYRVRQLNRLTAHYILPCRRRTDDTRRVLLVITVECLLAILNSWFGDILLSLVYCKRKLLADDDCPMFLRQNYGFLVMFDVFNSVSNIILHSLCGKRFRNELCVMLQSFCRAAHRLFVTVCCCYLQIQCLQKSSEQYVAYRAAVTENNSSNNSNSECVYLEIHPSSRALQHYCCDCRWYFNRQPLSASRQCLSAVSKECLRRKQPSGYHRRQSYTNSTHLIQNSMRLYFPSQETVPVTKAKGWLARWR